ncbi:MAG: acyl-CoA dehydrogenase C-terminal domain-containing protein, partial [Desulfosalsimonas sp.]
GKLAGGTDMEKILEKAGKNKDAAFYLGCIKTAEFFVKNLLPPAMGKLETIAETNGSAVEMPEASFGG